MLPLLLTGIGGFCLGVLAQAIYDSLRLQRAKGQLEVLLDRIEWQRRVIGRQPSRVEAAKDAP